MRIQISNLHTLLYTFYYSVPIQMISLKFSSWNLYAFNIIYVVTKTTSGNLYVKHIYV